MTPAHLKGLSLHVVFMLIPMLYNHQREVHGQILREMTNIIEAGHLKPILDEVEFSLGEIGAGHTRLTSGAATGKIVVDVQ